MNEKRLLTEHELDLAAGGRIPIISPLIEWFSGGGGCSLPGGGAPTAGPAPTRPLVPQPPTPIPFMDPPSSKRGMRPGREP